VQWTYWTLDRDKWHLLWIRELKKEKRGISWLGMWHAACGNIRNTYIFLLGKTYGERPLWRPRRRWENNIKRSLKNWDGRVCSGLNVVRIGTSDSYYEHGNWTLAFHKMRGISWLGEDVLASVERICFVKLFIKMVYFPEYLDHYID